MKLPTKIDPDQIKDSIVEIRFTSELPYEIYIGLIFHSLDNTYQYINSPLKLPFAGITSLFSNNQIQFEIQPGAIIFNCIGQYISWDNYKPEIYKVLQQVNEAKVIKNYNRVGIRYISEYPDKDIKEITNFSFSFGMPNVLSEKYLFQSEYTNEGYKIIINLSSKIPFDSALNTHSTISSIDIDVIKDNIDIQIIEELIKVVDDVHLKEKETFFKLLTDNFLSSLNPKY
jgi:uncharacterized protein (TIGR04255 family)